MGCRASQGGWESLRASHTSELVALWVGGAHSFVFLRLPPYMYRTVCIYIYIYTHIDMWCQSVSYLKLICFHTILFRKSSKSSGFAGTKLDQKNFPLVY